MNKSCHKASVNNFVLRFANVNGTGSASANSMVAKCMFRMGLSIGPKNMFPSNIQGLPTWYEIRVSDQGFTSRRGGVDLMVGMNVHTLKSDVNEIENGGYLLYDSTIPLKPELKNQNIHYLEIPITGIARRHFTNPRQRSLLQNMIYVGALSWLLRLDTGIIEQILHQQYKRKPKLIPLNLLAIKLGVDYCLEHFERLPFYAEPKPVEKTAPILISGNTALALGSLYAGATVCSWYPITPSTSVVEAFTSYCKSLRICKDTGKKNFSIIQAEDEISAMGMTLGAAWMGARSFTATSGPGISLMSEFLGFGYYAEIPAVIFNIQRCGPSTGMPTRNQQADLTLCAYASHGDTKHLMVFPSDPGECFQFGRKSFDWAERFQTPIFVMSDLEIGMNESVTEALSVEDEVTDRGKVLSHEQLANMKEPYFRYLDPDQDGIPYRTLPGTHPHGAYFTRGSGHDKFGRYTESSELYQENMLRIQKKFEQASKELPGPVIQNARKPTNLAILSYGSGWEALRESLFMLEKEGVFINHLRIRSFPFSQEILSFCQNNTMNMVLDLNRDAQMTTLLRTEFPEIASGLTPLCMWDGLPLQAETLSKSIKNLLPGS